MNTEAENSAQVQAAAARIDARPRDYLERVEEAARDFLRSRDHDTSPAAWAAAEDNLRRALNARAQ